MFNFRLFARLVGISHRFTPAQDTPVGGTFYYRYNRLMSSTQQKHTDTKKNTKNGLCKNDSTTKPCGNTEQNFPLCQTLRQR